MRRTITERSDKVKNKFCIEREDGNRHIFMSEKYARGYLKAIYEEILFKYGKEPERYEFLSKMLTNNEFRVSIKDKGRLYFLNKEEDIKKLLFSGRLSRQIMGGLSRG